MNCFKNLLISLFIFTQVYCDQVCYDGYGCFTTEAPFGGTVERPFSLLPEKPMRINTQFYLYNRLASREIITSEDLTGSFNKTAPVKFIAHGFYNTGDKQWILDMKDAFLKRENANIIVVDWSGGSGLPFTLAVANTQVVAVDISKLIEKIISETNLTVKDFHLVGHSLGAHICGYVGRRIKGLKRITGLDPAGPYFENTPAEVRLDISDADFVDIIHTHAAKLGDSSIGIFAPIGHVDFYPNGGDFQPGCWITDLNFDPTCSHGAACDYFTDSINSQCSYKAFPCDSSEDHFNGDCLNCGPSGCNRMGYWATPVSQPTSFYLQTQSVYSEDKCLQNFQVKLVSKDTGDKKAKGTFSMYLQSSGETSSTEVIDYGTIEFTSNSIEKLLLSLTKPMSNLDITKAFITYKRGWNIFVYESEWEFKYIEIKAEDSSKSIKLCHEVTFLDLTKETIEYVLC